METLVSNLGLFVILKSSGKIDDYQFLFHTVLSRLNYSLTEENRKSVKEFCRRFTRAVDRRWQAAHRKIEIFRREYGSWLEKNIDWPDCIKENYPEASISSVHDEELPTTSSVGTMTKRSLPRIPFEELGTKQKKRRSADLMNSDTSELVYATVSKLKADGPYGHMASVIEYMMKHPEKVEKFHDIVIQPVNKKTFTPFKALGLLIALKLSKWQYLTLRELTAREGLSHLYPSYYAVQKEKEECYPPEKNNSIKVTDSSARITLQALLDITAKIIIKSLPDEVKEKKMILTSKWGFDRASNQSKYKQKLESAQDDSSIFMTSLVPLKITCEEETLWENPKPCSAAFCRPIQFTFVKESETVVKEEEKKMKEEILALRPTEFDDNKISHNLMMTMIDAKVCTYLSEAKSNAACYICLAKPSELNNLEAMKKKAISTDMMQFGMSSLHARINMMECLLHISYRLDIKKWAVKEKADQDAREARKKMIQDRFKTELGLQIDVVKQGYGTTNDGNTARRFFENPEKTAAITGLDPEVIRRFAVILQAITSGEHVNIEKFREYTYKTAEKYVELYNWYYMSATVHKILIHGAEIIARNSIVPIGNLSEEASEARNKDFRRFGEHNSRKNSRVNTNEDIFNFLLLSSDPLISLTRPTLDARKKKSLFDETYSLLKCQEPEFEFRNVNQLDLDSDIDSDPETDSEDSD